MFGRRSIDISSVLPYFQLRPQDDNVKSDIRFPRYSVYIFPRFSSLFLSLVQLEASRDAIIRCPLCAMKRNCVFSTRPPWVRCGLTTSTTRLALIMHACSLSRLTMIRPTENVQPIVGDTMTNFQRDRLLSFNRQRSLLGPISDTCTLESLVIQTVEARDKRYAEKCKVGWKFTNVVYCAILIIYFAYLLGELAISKNIILRINETLFEACECWQKFISIFSNSFFNKFLRHF